MLSLQSAIFDGERLFQLRRLDQKLQPTPMQQRTDLSVCKELPATSPPHSTTALQVKTVL